jgi:hypothetical protein
MSGLAPLAFGGFLLPLGVVILAIVAVAGGRAEPDPDSERPAALYLTAVSFVAVFALLFSVFGLADGLLNLTINHDTSSAFGRTQTSFGSSSSGFSSSSGSSSSTAPLIPSSGGHDGDYRTIVESLVVGALAAALFLTHRRWLQVWLATHPSGPGSRVWHTYQYVACFFAVLAGLIAAASMLYAVFRFAAPGVTGTGTRGEAMVSLFTSAVLAVGAAGVFLFHWNDSPLAASVGWRWPAARPVAPPPAPQPPEPGV